MISLQVRRDPLNTLVDEFFSDFFNRTAAAPRARNGEPVPATRAAIDVVDKNDRYEVLVDLPGVKKEDIQVTVEGARVAIAAKAQALETAQDERVLHSERRAVRYARTFELPAEVTEDNSAATFDNGVLKLVLPKRAAAASKRITIQ
jgi:HSP20 family protein